MKMTAAMRVFASTQKIKHQTSLVKDAARRKEFEDLIDKHWPPKCGKRKPPEHWSGKTIALRAKEAGVELEMMYRYEYTVNRNLSHSGIAFIAGMPPDFFVNAFGLGHVNFQKLLLKSSVIVAESLHLFDAKPTLRRRLQVFETLPQEITLTNWLEPPCGPQPRGDRR
jgi:hypothetical protein